MSGATRRTSRTPATTPPPNAATACRSPKSKNDRNHAINLFDFTPKTLTLTLIIGSLLLIFVAFLVFENPWTIKNEDPMITRIKRSVTPLPAPKMMDLEQFQGEHKEQLYWGTYRPHVYLGIRARTPKSLIAGLMWIGVKDNQYLLRHVCQESDGLSTYGWTDHNGRDYGRQILIDNGLSLTTSFLKEKGLGSGYGGDWAVRLDLQNDRSSHNDHLLSSQHIFFYVADEGGNPLSMKNLQPESHAATLLASGAHIDLGGWELHFGSQDKSGIHFSGFRTLHMHNLTDLVQLTLAVHSRRTGKIELPDIMEDNSNFIIFQISSTTPAIMDFAFVSGTNLNSRVSERVNNLTGDSLTTRLERKQTEFEEKFIGCFNLKDKVNQEEMAVGKAAIANMLGGIGYFYGQSKIALPSGFTQSNGNNYILYWPSALFTAVPSRSFFPRGFLWDEGFHQLIIWRWDMNLSMDIVGHWLDLINIDGWIPREQILGAEALSKVPEEFVVQYPSNGNPPTLFLVLREMLNGLISNKFSTEASNGISVFLDRAYNRFDAWFQWFNTTQSGKDIQSFYWHGRDSTTNKELNPKTLSSGLDDYPRASHPSDEERHLDLRCWMLLAADCMTSVAELHGAANGLKKEYHLLTKRLSDFENLNKMHLDGASGAYFDFGNHTEKVRLKWHETKHLDTVKRELVRETKEAPKLALVPHIGYVGLFPFMMGIIPVDSRILEKQLDLISNRSTLWTDYGLRSLSKTSSIYMKRNTEHDPPYWRGPIWININYLILSALKHYSQVDGPYTTKAENLYQELRSNLIRNIAYNYYKNGYLFEQYDQANKGNGKGARPFTGWTSLVLLIMAEEYPNLQRQTVNIDFSNI